MVHFFVHTPEEHAYLAHPKDVRNSGPSLMVPGGIRALGATIEHVAGGSVDPKDRVRCYVCGGLRKLCYHANCGAAGLLYNDPNAIQRLYKNDLKDVGAVEYHMKGSHTATKVAIFNGELMGRTDVFCTDDRFEPNKNPLTGEPEFGLHLGKFDRMLGHMQRFLGADGRAVSAAAGRAVEVWEFLYKALVPGFGAPDIDLMRLPHERFAIVVNPLFEGRAIR